MANGFERYEKKTPRAEFLEETELVLPWAELAALIEPHYPQAGNGRRPVGSERFPKKLKEEISHLFVAAGTTVDEFYDGVEVGNLEAMHIRLRQERVQEYRAAPRRWQRVRFWFSYLVL